MSIFVGNKEILTGNLKVGGSDIKEVYVGSEKVWPSGPPPDLTLFVELTISANSSTELLVTTVGNNLGCWVLNTKGNDESVFVPPGSTEFAIDVLVSTEHIVYVKYDPADIATQHDYICFEKSGGNESLVRKAVVKDLTGLSSLERFFLGHGALSEITFEASTANIQYFLYSFKETGLLYPPTNISFEACFMASALYQDCPHLIGDIVMDMPMVGNIDSLFRGCTSSTLQSITLITPVVTNANRSFSRCKVSDYVEVQLVKTDSTFSLPNTFEYLDCPCVIGVIDTRGASNHEDLFLGFTGSVPSSSEIADLQSPEGALYDNDSCDVAPPTPAPLVPPLTSNNGPGLSVTAQHNNPEGWLAFDRVENTNWNPGVGLNELSSITVNFDNAYTFTEFSITADGRQPHCPPSYLKVEGFAGSFVTLYENLNFSLGEGQTIAIPISNSTPFTKFKVSVKTDIIECEGRGIQVAELQVTGY